MTKKDAISRQQVDSFNAWIAAHSQGFTPDVAWHGEARGEAMTRLSAALRQGTLYWLDMIEALNLLHDILDHADVLGEDSDSGETFLLLAVETAGLARLAAFGAMSADMEPDDEGPHDEDREPDTDLEPPITVATNDGGFSRRSPVGCGR